MTHACCRRTGTWTWLIAIATLLASHELRGDDRPQVPVVLISIDGLVPDYLFNADRLGLKIPHLRRLLGESAYATGVIGVTPTVTYPSHTTMVTGVSPAKHGILTNYPFDPLGKNLSGWYWYSEDIRVPTLWDVATQAGLVTSGVDWPVTVGANIRHNIAQYWRASTPDDHKILRAVSTAGLVVEAEAAVGKYPEGNDYTIAADRRRASFNAYILESKRPRFHLCYFSGLDTEQHQSGPYSAQTFSVLEQTDELVGEVRAAAERAGGGQAIVAVVSDHGFARTDKEISLNAAFTEAGLIQVDERGRAAAWRAFAWVAGGSAGIHVRDRDAKTRDEVRAVLDRVARESDGAFHRILEGSEIGPLAGYSEADYVVSLRPGARLASNLRGPVIESGRIRGTHGYLPEFAEMDAVFLIAGPGIRAGTKWGRVDMRDVAPTLAAILGVQLPAAEGKNLLQRGERNP